MDVFDTHQTRIALDTLRMSDMGARIMGGMTKDAAREVLMALAGWSAERVHTWEHTP